MSAISELNEWMLDLVRTERMKQDRKWGEQNHGDLYWLGILVEEMGELAKAIIEDAIRDTTTKELTQVAAVAVAWMECRQHRAGKEEG